MLRSNRTPTCGGFLAHLRRRHGLTQAQLAERAEMTQANISRLERDGSSPSLATLNRIVEAMGETLTIGTLDLDDPPPGGGNVSVRELRRDFETLTPGQRVEQAAMLSKAAAQLAASRSPS